MSRKFALLLVGVLVILSIVPFTAAQDDALTIGFLPGVVDPFYQVMQLGVEASAEGYVARGAGGQGSAQLRPLAAANALLIVPEGTAAAEQGSTYDAVVIGEIS